MKKHVESGQKTHEGALKQHQTFLDTEVKELEAKLQRALVQIQEANEKVTGYKTELSARMEAEAQERMKESRAFKLALSKKLDQEQHERQAKVIYFGFFFFFLLAIIVFRFLAFYF